MASTADSINIIEQWKEDLKELFFPELDPGSFKEEYLGSGLYGDTSIFNHNGISYAAKKIHISIFSQDNFREKFTSGCLQLSRLRHPHVTQFLGVQITDPFTPPVLISEFYPLSLSICFLRYPEIPEYSKYLILLEISLALSYLHQLPIPVVHGHLSPNNILLTEGLHVKIADAVSFELENSTPTNSPYQPPEGKKMEAGDIFCLGDITIHVILQKEVSPLEYKHHRNPENVNEPFIFKEVERRKRFLDEVEETHPLKSLILRCLEEEPEQRPTAYKVTEELSICVEQYKPEYQNILDMFIALGKLSLMKDTVTGLSNTVEAKNEEIDALKSQIEPHKLEVQAKEEIIATLKEEMSGYKQALQSKEGRIKANETGVRAKDALIKAKDREIAAKMQVITTKEFLLKSANKRIEVLEKHAKNSRNRGRPPSLPDLHYELKNLESTNTSPDNMKSNGLKSFKLYRGLSPSPHSRPYRGSSSSPHGSEGFKTQQGSNQTDPKLAKILARQQQKLEELDCVHEIKDSKSSDQKEKPKVKRRSSKAEDSTTPELMAILKKRKSFIEDI